MLYSNLKLAGYKYIDPVYVGFCGVRKLFFALLNDLLICFISFFDNVAHENDHR